MWLCQRACRFHWFSLIDLLISSVKESQCVLLPSLQSILHSTSAVQLPKPPLFQFQKWCSNLREWMDPLLHACHSCMVLFSSPTLPNLLFLINRPINLSWKPISRQLLSYRLPLPPSYLQPSIPMDRPRIVFRHDTLSLHWRNFRHWRGEMTFHEHNYWWKRGLLPKQLRRKWNSLRSSPIAILMIEFPALGK